MTFKYLTVLSLGLLLLTSCGQEKKEEVKPEPKETKAGIVDEFADIKILQYEIPGWENLSLEKQKLVYYMTQAGLSGRDMMWAQNYRHNLTIRKALENVYTTYTGDKNTEDWKNFETFVNMHCGGGDPKYRNACCAGGVFFFGAANGALCSGELVADQ